MNGMLATTEYVINSGLWSVGGLAVGYMLGRAETKILRRWRGTDDDHT